ncbi:MAG: ABC transporter permease [Candidatus Cloacimonetes bacterium]|nr:ABC transporter permease [Candidatus Cloacimonadota bacterium]
MFKNYLKTAFRNMLRNKAYSMINILGLAIAMTVCLIILLWCRYELNYDKFLPNFERLYRVNTEFQLSEETKRYAASPEPTGPTLKERFPEISHHCHFYQTTGLMVYDNKKISESNLVYTDNDFLEMFSIQPISGNISTMLNDPYSIVLTQKMAKKYFGEKNPLGEIIRRNDSRDYKISGVIEDFPENATYNYDFLMSVNLFKELELEFLGRWGNISGETFIMTEPDIDEKELGEKIWGVPSELSTEENDCFLWLQPLSKIHLYDLDGGGAVQYLYIFMIIGLIVLIIACINFMNLSTARSSLRAKEVGLRKVSGAQRGQLIRQFFFESILQAALAMIIAIAASEIIITSFERFAHINSSLNIVGDYKLILGFVGITLFTGLFAGSYPALFLSGFNPITVLKGVFSKGKKGSFFRYTLVVIQFSLSIILIISTLIVFKQMNFMKKHNLGFNKDNLMYLPIKGELNEKFPEFRAELAKIPGIENITRSSSILTNIGFVASGLDWEGKAEEEDPIFSFVGIDYEYFKTCKMELVAGRGYSREFTNDEANYILNETAIERIGYKNDPIGKPFDMWGRKGKIIGVVKDFNFQSLSQPVDPLILTNFPNYFSYILIRIDTENIPQLIDEVENTWNRFVTQFPFDYKFMDQDFDKLYEFETNIGSLFKIFTILAVFISGLGLFGLSMFVVDRRTKEIGVRKVMGASASGIVILLIRDFTKWVLFANIIAWPLAWFAMDKWLQNYAFRTQLSAIPFIYAGLSALLISIITVFFHTYKAANSNPVKALKYE